MAATKQQGETASQALRRFISDYIEEARLAEQPHPVQEISMTIARHRLKTLATAAGAALGVFSITALPSAADSSAFDALDKNKDGVLTEGEIAPGYDADIISTLDTDGSGGVSREELEAAGDHIVIRDDETTSDEDGKTVTRKTVKVLEFSDSADGVIQGEVKTEVDRKIIIKRMDSGSELSEAEMEALIEEALAEAGGMLDDAELITETIHEEVDEDGNKRVIIKKMNRSEKTVTTDEETESED
ncbi:MAG: EF-hand domain-containing protein [Henriciella sp.]